MNEKNHRIRVNRIAIDEQIPVSDVERVVADYMQWVHDKMRDDDLFPDVKIPYFGRFTVKIPKMRRKIRTKINQYRNGKITREKCVEVVSKLWEVYRRKVEYRHRSMRYKRFDGKRIKRKIPLWWQKKYIPHIWPELNLPPATEGKYAGLYNSKGEYIGKQEEE